MLSSIDDFVMLCMSNVKFPMHVSGRYNNLDLMECVGGQNAENRGKFSPPASPIY